MKVTIIVGGRFHAFDLAQQLQKHNMLYQLVTTYPKSKIRRFNIDENKLITFPLIEYFKRGVHKLFGFYPLNFLLSDLFDKLASKKIKKNADIYIIWAGMALDSIKKIRKVNPNAKIIIERGSTHIIEQNELLKKITGKNIVDKRTIDKETQEYELADYIVIPSEFNKKTFLKQNINKLFVNNYGVDLMLFKPLLRNNNDFFTVGYAGTLSARKNVKNTIKVIKKLNINKCKIKLNLVGHIDAKTFSESLLNEDFITYKTAIPQIELVSFFNELDVFVINSIEEGLALVILQALSCGIPVIATENSGGAEVIKNCHNGFIVPSFSNDALQEKIEIMCNLSAEKRKEMSKNALCSVKSGFTWDDYGNRYVEFLKTITE